MSKHLCAVAILVGLACGAAATAHAGANAAACLMFHMQTVTTKNACGPRGTPACRDINTRATLLPSTYFAYLLVTDGNATAGIGGLQCGIQYDGAPNSGVDIYTWTLCATLEFQSTGWPASGGGNLITWDTASRCQRTEPGFPGTGVIANAGYFYCAAYSPDFLSVIPRPVDGRAMVADCQSNEDLIGGVGFPSGGSRLGSANFSVSGQSYGYNPACGFDPVEATTWSGIKAAFH